MYRSCLSTPPPHHGATCIVPGIQIKSQLIGIIKIFNFTIQEYYIQYPIVRQAL